MGKKFKRNFLVEKQNGRCFYCKVKLSAKGKFRATIDHYIPVCRAIVGMPNNKVAACEYCNRAKGARDKHPITGEILPDSLNLYTNDGVAILEPTLKWWQFEVPL